MPQRMTRMDPRLYCVADGPAWQEGHDVSLTGGQAHYLGKVMRLQPDHLVKLFNGRDGEWSAQIKELKRHSGAVRLLTQERPQQETDGVELLFSPLKRDATELVIRMGTELGVTRFRPVVTARTNTHRLNYERLSLIAQEAAEQCERLDVPDIMPMEPLAALLARWPARRPLSVALEREGEGLASSDSEALLIGPEGGFSEEEIRRLTTHEAVRCFSLGALVLRAETAVCAGLSQLDVRRRGAAQ